MISVVVNGRSYGLPPSWSRMGFSAKCGYLCGANIFRRYEDAAAWLRSRPRRKKVTAQEAYAEMERRGLA